MSVLSMERVGRRYGSPPVVALDDVSLTVQAGEMLAVMGPSGSGKSTLLLLAGGLTRPTFGRVVLSGSDLGTLGEADQSLVVGTLALAIASFAIVAVPGLLNASMQSQVRQARLFDVAVATRDLDLSSRQLATLARVPNVAAFEPAVEYSTVAASGSTGSNQGAVVWGFEPGPPER